MGKQKPSISFRVKPVGGEVENSPTCNPKNVLTRMRHLVLLIHGFNVSQEDAERTYDAFRQVQHEMGGIPAGLPVASGRLVDVYWPGDADWGIVSALFYPLSISKAKQVASALAKSLRNAIRISGPKVIDIVAHSLGSRLTLELLKSLRGVEGILLRRIVVMAAAVPTFMLERNDINQLRESYEEMIRNGGEGMKSVFSSDDNVLRIAFRLGQTAALGHEGFFPTAFGYEYWLGESPPGMSQLRNDGAGHSDYWGSNKNKKPQSLLANATVRDFLGFEGIGRREVHRRQRSPRDPVARRSNG